MKVNDTHLILLTTASQRENGSLIPLPEALGDAADRVRKGIAALLKNGLVQEGEVATAADAWRQECDTHVGIRITSAGLKAIGIDRDDGGAEEPQAPGERVTKANAVLAMLQRDEGATLDEIISATGWLPHTTRAALTGLRKKGHAIEKRKRGDITCWLVKAA